MSAQGGAVTVFAPAGELTMVSAPAVLEDGRRLARAGDMVVDFAGVTVAVAALRHGATSRWIGWVGAVLGGVTLLLGISPLQYMAGMTGPLWLLVTAVRARDSLAA